MKTQIVCTIGPASDSIPKLTAMIKNGMRIARLNFSHGDYKSHARLIKNIRSVSKKLNMPVLIMQDLQGPKIRVDELKKPITVKKNQIIVIGKDFTIGVDISKEAKVGERVFIQDGLIELKIVKIDKEGVVCKAINGGKIIAHKGVNLPDTKLALPSLTEKDLKDLKWGFTKNFDYVAISFVRSVADTEFLKKQLKGVPRKPKIVAKIEKPEAVKNIDSIIKSVDMVMVARGDLGVEIPEEKVPKVQRTIIKKCHKYKKPVIVATQMLESMVGSPRPTRAEVEDVADAVLEGASFTMLSEETAFGQYPVEAVSEMQKIIKENLN
jgi:pyruvate kinase